MGKTITSNRYHLPLGLLILTLLGGSAMAAESIKKCQDEEGKWHYGSFAAQECAKSVVTELNEKGSKIGENVPPPTREVLKAKETERLAKQRELVAIEAQRKKDEDLIHIYGSEEVILSTRDRKLASIDKNLDVTQQIRQGILKDIDALSKREQTTKVKDLIAVRERAIKSYDDVIRQNLFERNKLSSKYEDILLRFREASLRAAK